MALPGARPSAAVTTTCQIAAVLGGTPRASPSPPLNTAPPSPPVAIVDDEVAAAAPLPPPRGLRRSFVFFARSRAWSRASGNSVARSYLRVITARGGEDHRFMAQGARHRGTRYLRAITAGAGIRAWSRASGNSVARSYLRAITVRGGEDQGPPVHGAGCKASGNSVPESNHSGGRGQG